MVGVEVYEDIGLDLVNLGSGDDSIKSSTHVVSSIKLLGDACEVEGSDSSGDEVIG